MDTTLATPAFITLNVSQQEAAIQAVLKGTTGTTLADLAIKLDCTTDELHPRLMELLRVDTIKFERRASDDERLWKPRYFTPTP